MESTNLHLWITTTVETIKEWIQRVNKNNDTTIDTYAAQTNTNLNSADAEIDALEASGKFLSLWDAATGLPITNPESLPYTYHKGDYFIVSNISSATNYMPAGTTYTGAASVTATSQTLRVGHIFAYHGNGEWKLSMSSMNLPAAPSAAGTYKLQGTVDSQGAVSYDWLKPISSCTASQSSSITWTGSTQTENIVVYDGSTELVRGTDYTLSGTTTASAAGTYNVVITGMGNYYGTMNATWTITGADISAATVTLGTSLTYNATQQTQMFSVTLGSRTLSGDDYTYTGSTATNAGTYTITITGKGNYTGTVAKDWTMASFNLSNAYVQYIGSHTYTGNYQTTQLSEFRVKFSENGDYISSSDYTMSMLSRKDAGTYGNYTEGKTNTYGSKSAYWTIDQAPLTITSPSVTVELGETEPIWTYTYSGFVNNETSSVLTTLPSTKILDADGNEVTYATASATAGTYRLVPYGAAATNYSMSYVEGTLTVEGPAIEYLCFTSPSAFTIGLAHDNSTEVSGFYYSFDKSTWTELLTSSSAYTVVSVGANTPVYFKGTTGAVSSGLDYFNFKMTGSNIAASGDAMTLYGDNCNNNVMTQYGFLCLFQGCTSLISAPDFPATTLATGCYFKTFNGCTNLTSAPSSLPALSLQQDCYGYMFYGCSALTTPPTLSATSLASNCCSYMFEGCSKLSTTPELLATNLQDYCYYRMFAYCSALTTSTSLPATSLKQHCYYQMFYACIKLTTAPALPATTLASYAYAGMFRGCTKLTTPPALPATTLVANCYSEMFYGCHRLATAPVLPAMTVLSGCYSNMFYNCVGLTTPPELPATTLDTGSYQGMFYGCAHLTSAPNLPATTLKPYCYYQMFYRCYALTTTATMSATTLATYCCKQMYYNCSSLTTITALPGSETTSISEEAYEWMFYGCTALVNPPTLSATSIGKNGYHGMFQGCTSLTSAPILPATSLSEYCYYEMFKGCTALTTAPSLGCAFVPEYGYYGMFENCTSLTTMPRLLANEVHSGSYTNMFKGCTSLIVSSTSGTGYSQQMRIPYSGTFSLEDLYYQNSVFTNCQGTRSSEDIECSQGTYVMYYTQNAPV